MKTHLLITAVLLVLARLAIAQCAAHAGGNKHFCMGIGGVSSPTIGGTPTATGGTPSYTYCWSTDVIPLGPGSIYFFTASDVLNDSTAANPAIIDMLGKDSIKLYLKITDALGCVSRDTCIISCTRFAYSIFSVDIYVDQDFINSGDSIDMNSTIGVAGSPFTPYTYSWQPAYGLSTTTLATGFHALPAVSTNYSVTVTDAMGCHSVIHTVYYVVVCSPGYTVGYTVEHPCAPVGIKENSANKINTSVYPNPVSTHITVELPQGNVYSMKLCNTLGFTCKEISLADVKTNINLSQLTTGIYFLQVFENGNLVAVKKVIKE